MSHTTSPRQQPQHVFADRQDADYWRQTVATVCSSALWSLTKLLVQFNIDFLRGQKWKELKSSLATVTELFLRDRLRVKAKGLADLLSAFCFFFFLPSFKLTESLWSENSLTIRSRTKETSQSVACCSTIDPFLLAFNISPSDQLPYRPRESSPWLKVASLVKIQVCFLFFCFILTHSFWLFF